MGAESTFSWLVAVGLGKPDLTLNIAREAVSYSVMMSRIAVVYYLDAAEVCTKSHGLPMNPKYESLKQALLTSIEEIAPAAGVPIEI